MIGLRFSRVALAAVGLTLAASACLRLSEPNFVCDADNDCPDDHKCNVSGECIAEGSCVSHSDCGNFERCNAGRCGPAPCSSVLGAAACNGFACDVDQRLCRSSCTSPSNGCAADYACRQGACVPAPSLPNGSACMDFLDCASRKCCVASPSNLCLDSCDAVQICTSDTDCLSGCCVNGACTSVGCGEVGAVCTTSSDCDSGSCVAGVCNCVEDVDCGGTGWCSAGECATQLLQAGDDCTANVYCDSGSCVDGKCRGTAGSGDTCTVELDCAGNRTCCASPYNDDLECSELDSGCDGANGDDCGIGGDGACLSEICLGYAFCSQECTTDADCGKDPAGNPNFCRMNALGDLVCFRGCGDDDCDLLLGMTCTDGVCAGGTYDDYEVQLW